AFSFPRQRWRSPLCKSVWVVVLDTRQHAELVAAEPVGATLALDRGVEPVRDASEQGVAGRVAERVVVRLEAVEVEDDQREGQPVIAERSVELEHEPAAVAEPGQRVGQSLFAPLREEL